MPFTPTRADLDRLADLEEGVAEFLSVNELDEKVGRIMRSMVPEDVERVLEEGVDLGQCRSATAVAIARIRRVEMAAGRPNALRRHSIAAHTAAQGRRPSAGAQHSNSRSRSRCGRARRPRAPRRRGTSPAHW